MTASTDWPAYLDTFHAANPGITEDVVARCAVDGGSPYDWLIDGLDPSAPILDIACGSGSAKPTDAHRWIGVDLSAAELQRARGDGRVTVILGDATNLPVPDACFDAITCSMALMLVDPLDRAVAEICRALRPGGRLLLLLPARSPLTVRDRITYLRLFWAARSTTKFPPSPLRHRAANALAAHGLEVESDQHRRFSYPLIGTADAERFVNSWYLPGTPPERRAAAGERAAALAPTSIGVPFRRVIACKPR